MPGAIVPVSGELYGTSRVGSGTAGACRAGFLGGAGGFAPTSCAGTARCVSGSAGAGCAGFARWRAAAIFALTFCTCSLICLHPEVAIINSAHVNSVLRRMSSLHRVKDTGAVPAAQGRDGARVFHSMGARQDRKKTRLESRHGYISTTLFCLKKKKVTNVHH